jgi:hypothetical protein
MNLEVTLWFFVGILVFSVVNLLIATVLVRRRAAQTVSAVPVVDVLALALILLVIMAATITDVLLIIPAAPAIGRPVLYGVGALFFEVAGRLFKLLPSTPRWLPRLLRIVEIALLVLAVIGIVLTILIRPA